MNRPDLTRSQRRALRAVAHGDLTGHIRNLYWANQPLTSEDMHDLRVLAGNGLITLGDEGPKLTRRGIGMLNQRGRPSDAVKGLAWAVLVVSLLVVTVAVWWVVL